MEINAQIAFGGWRLVFDNARVLDKKYHTFDILKTLFYIHPMNPYLQSFVQQQFSVPGMALDLGAGDFSDVNDLEKLGWTCEGVDIKTGTNLEHPYQSDKGPFDLVYSNYVLHKLTNKQQLIQTIFKNLKHQGRFFLHVMDNSDTTGLSPSGITKESLTQMLKTQGFQNLQIKLLDIYDDEEGHKHWHHVLEATGQKI